MAGDQFLNQPDRLVIFFFKHMLTVLYDFALHRRDTGMTSKAHSTFTEIYEVIRPPILHVVLILQTCDDNDDRNFRCAYHFREEVVVDFHYVTETRSTDAVYEKADAFVLEVQDKFLEAFDGTICRDASMPA